MDIWSDRTLDTDLSFDYFQLWPFEWSNIDTGAIENIILLFIFWISVSDDLLKSELLLNALCTHKKKMLCWMSNLRRISMILEYSTLIVKSNCQLTTSIE